jgi:menaquinone-dependent protoporphyrinogen oxidase
MPSAFFSVNIVARKPEKNRPETNPYMKKFLRQIAWRPMLVAVFAGKLDYPRYGFLDRMMIRLIMALTKGPTDPSTVVEFTDWRQVDAFAGQVEELHRNHRSAESICC